VGPHSRGTHQTHGTRICVLLALVSAAACTDTTIEWSGDSVPEPTIFAEGIVSTDAREYGITFTPDGTEAYFTRRNRRGPSSIHVTRYVDGNWSEPELADFSTDRDEAPFITEDGSRMLFSSRRPARGSWDRSENIWVMERGPEGWGDPLPLSGTVNQPRSEVDDYATGTELGPIVLPDGLLLYWTRADAEWGSDLYVAELDESDAYVNPRPLRINSYGDESNPAMSPDGRFLVFQGYRDAQGFGEQDLYVSEKTEYGWSDPRLLPEPINSERSDGYPSFSPDGRYFFFASDRSARGGYYDIYYVDYEALGLEPTVR